MRSGIVGAVMVLVAFAGAGGEVAAGPIALELMPHRAIYDMSLASTKLGGGVTAASGAMTYKFGDSCDGWTVENKTVLTFAYSDGAPVATTWDFVTWESKDGLHYRFRVRSTRDGVVNEDIDGVANLDGLGKGGVARFSLPEPKVMRLPKGTLFPTEHTIMLLETAEKGGRSIERVLFDGTGTDGPFDVNAVIGKLSPANSNNGLSVDPVVSPAMLSAPSWPMQMAFYLRGSKDPTPDYEVALRYYLNGVADEVLQSFGNFSLKGRLQKLEPLPRPDC